MRRGIGTHSRRRFHAQLIGVFGLDVVEQDFQLVVIVFKRNFRRGGGYGKPVQYVDYRKQFGFNF